MFSIFKRKTKNDERDIEQLIFDVAEHQRDADFHLLYLLLKDREVFVPVVRSSVPSAAKPGEAYVTRTEDQLVLKTVELPGNGAWAPAATQAISQLVAGGYVGMPWLGFLNMVMKIEDVRGAFLQGQTSWVALDKQRVAYILAQATA
ncbi:MAG: hypothetical protein Q7T36_09385 [Fluviicoccus sp.]|uniref:hypothetical protein n=1 Tax=Fluviicoccus sp. TaxID=2003552 RepID=UPI002722FE21|nr:hypothetical protein [Fluviicoccus sp.]MDO8330671.1 hypothetical protein [Fluviicoccus sp.]